MPVRAVTFKPEHARKFAQNAVSLLVRTGGRSEAVVTIWQRDGYPPVVEVMARAGEITPDMAGRTVTGVEITVGFDRPIDEHALGTIAFSIYQDDLNPAEVAPCDLGFTLGRTFS